MTGSSRPGAFVVSLDFELRWGVRDHCPPGSPYERSLLGAREAIPRMLALFREYGISATWATVGFLFATSREELEAFRPAVLPEYADRRLFPYDDRVGANEEADPLHFAPSLIEEIARTPGQEIGTHTYSHYFCNEPGQTREQFRADLSAAVAIAARRGVRPRSIVFPRNQFNPSYGDVLVEHGITTYRGNPVSWMWTFGTAAESATAAKRLARAADTYLPLDGSGSVDWSEVPRPGGLADVRASRVLRPHDPRLRALEGARLARIRSAMREAARSRRIFHLWWHPHNFGAHPGPCLDFLERVLAEFTSCREAFGMRSLTMSEAADLAGMPTAEPVAGVTGAAGTRGET